MTIDPLERLHVDVPTLEPDPVLLSRLAAASAAASPSTRPAHGSTSALPRMLLAAASVAAIAVAAWGVAQLPDGGSPPTPVQSPGRVHTTAPPSPDRDGGPDPTRGSSAEPGADVPTSPASGSIPPVGPGTAGSDPGRSGDTPSTAGVPDQASGAGSAGSRGSSSAGGSGKHLGQTKSHPKKPDHPDKPGKRASKRPTTKPTSTGDAAGAAADAREKSQKTTS